ncbi:Putative hemerythrin-like protein [Rhodospirillaceae bacterium LM-1]|nr:Putative hemerythrin-like protein [Rhodospirillaceae bacterium LM-1]
MQWDDALEVGVPSIDEDHRNIVTWVSDLQEMGAYSFPHKTLVYVFDSLVDYVSIHFRREESAMTACSFDGLEPHRKAHEEFEQIIHKVRHQLLENADFIFENETFEFIFDWLLTHISQVDVLMASSVRGSKAAIEAADKFPRAAIKTPASS